MAENFEHLPPELRPDENGKYPELTPQLLKRLRGKYFTVKHPRLTACGHKMDLMNEPRTNCEDCWFAWFNTHQKLVEVADEMYRAKGKEALIGMRGKRFFKMFVRFMVTIIQLAKEQEQRGTDSGATQTSGEGLEAGSVRETVLSGGQAEGSGDGGEVAQ
jgi:hypothetical protein